VAGQRPELGGAAESRRKRHRRRELRARLGGQAGEQRRVEQARRDRADADLARGEVALTLPFEAAYATWPICPSYAAIDAVLTITPRSPLSESGSLPSIAELARRSA